MTGVSAAAVTTVVAVVASTHAFGGDPSSSTATSQEAKRHDDARVSRSDPRRPAPSTSASASLEQRLSRKADVPADLELGGHFRHVGGHRAAPTHGKRAVRYHVDVEKGLQLDGKLFAAFVHKTLNDARSWAGHGAMSFTRASSDEQADFTVTLASPATVGKWCRKAGLDTTEDNVSCDAYGTDRVMLNGYRWGRGAKTYGDDILNYRRMLVNHEVGHRIGHNHVGCPKDGARAPVMMQQTKTLTTHGHTCEPYPWTR